MIQMSQSNVDLLLQVWCSPTLAKSVVRPPGVSYNITHIIEGGTAGIQCIRHSYRCGQKKLIFINLLLVLVFNFHKRCWDVN